MGAISQPSSPWPTSEDPKDIMLHINTSVRESPPPMTVGDRGMTNGAILSPPESSTSSEDDDLPQMRGRRLDTLKVKELHETISQIPQQHGETPPDKALAGHPPVVPSQVSTRVAESVHHSFSTSTLEGLAHQGGCKLSHVRSATEPGILLSKSSERFLTGSKEETDEESRKKPTMVRKKSGELVQPALRSSSRRQPSSMPGTPTFGKAVHFDSHLEDIRHFLQVDRPLAVSAGSLPSDNYDSDNNFPFSDNEHSESRLAPYDWEIIMTDFPVETPLRKAQAVGLERVWLSNDQKCLAGSIAVANLAFQKNVICRFTLDYWKTMSEVVAEYVGEIQPKETPQSRDRFHFAIELSDLANLESKTLYFCICYSVNGQDFWDNNNGINFPIDFKRKMLPQNGKNFQGATSKRLNSLPLSNCRTNHSMFGMDDFGVDDCIDFDQPIDDYLGKSDPKSSLRLKGIKPNSSLASDNLSSQLTAPSSQAFANRYDLGASLSAAVWAAKGAMMSKPDGVYMKSSRKLALSADANTAKTVTVKEPVVTTQAPVPSAPAAPQTFSPMPTLPVPRNNSPSSTINASSLYEDLINKYCLVRTADEKLPPEVGYAWSSNYNRRLTVFSRTVWEKAVQRSSPRWHPGGRLYRWRRRWDFNTEHEQH
jgi:hypothetical protein